MSLFTFSFSAAQKARDEFDEAEKALREVDDNIRYISDCDASSVVDILVLNQHIIS